MPKTLRPVVALVYDFDGTLAPGNMQEPRFIPDVGMTRDKFWAEVRDTSKEYNADQTLMYMLMMLEKAGNKVPIRLQDFRDTGQRHKAL